MRRIRAGAHRSVCAGRRGYDGERDSLRYIAPKIQKAQPAGCAHSAPKANVTDAVTCRRQTVNRKMATWDAFRFCTLCSRLAGRMPMQLQLISISCTRWTLLLSGVWTYTVFTMLFKWQASAYTQALLAVFAVAQQKSQLRVRNGAYRPDRLHSCIDSAQLHTVHHHE